MKTNQKTSASKLATRFDRELKNILMNDLKALKEAKVRFLNGINGNLLPAA
jgi:hypothetical protein